jgi:predicted ribosome quality control (RQC) complex YloA/Tae2 family protein
MRVGLQYNLSMRQNYGGAAELTTERVRQGLQKVLDRQQAQPEATGKKAKKAGKDALRKALAVSITECSPLLVDHALHVARFDSTLKPEQVLADDELLGKLVLVLKDARKITDEITTPDQIKGYILAKPNPAAQKGDDEASSDKSKLLYDDFHPFRPAQFEDSDYTFVEFDGFNKAVDEFFSSIEGQKLESKLTEREQQARKKLEKARKEHEDRIGGLQEVQQTNFRKAEAILANVHRVTEATEAVNGLIRQGMDWVDIARLIEREQNSGNAVAQFIKLPLKLHENTITLLLDETNWEGEDEEDEGNETSSVSEDTDDEEDSPKKKAAPIKVNARPQLAIDIDLSMTAWANSTEYFDQKKTAASKEDRTLQASTRALKSHEKKVTEDLKKGLKQEKEILRPVRKQQWFEKFIYFISSDGYLVLGGKDAQQNEIIYRRFLRKGDVYVHADLKGAMPMIIKNKPDTPDAPIPPSTLSQAGNLCICTSDAWDSKAVMSAWWVRSDQVSKTGQTGEFLPAGMFNVKGKKEFLPPAQLVVGLAVLFEISESSKANHHKHRVQETAVSAAEMAPESEPADDSKIAEASKTDNSDDDDDDDEFPDAKIGSDSDDDFPDAKMEQTEESDAESDTEAAVPRSNPLQSRTTDARDEDSDDDEPATAKEDDEYAMSGGRGAAATDESQEDAGSVADTEKTLKTTDHRHLSARERRLQRKGQLQDLPSVPFDSAPATDAPDDDEEVSAEENTKASAKAPATVTSQATKASNAPLPRGKRAKAKKQAAKYAAQDEEDRELAMRLLGSKSGQQVAETAAQEKREKEEQAAADKQRRRDQHLRAQAAGKAAEEARLRALENAEDDDEGEEVLKTNLQNLDAFTGRPLPNDELLSAIPVCAPWSALSAYKYKAKIQPGSTKRGKAVKEVLSIWDHAGKDVKALDKSAQDTERIWPKEIEMIRGWKETEVVGVVPVSKVRVMIAGGRRGADIAKGKKKSARGGRGSKKK